MYCLYTTIAVSFSLELMAAPKNGEMEQLTTPLRVSKPFDGMHSEDLPKAIVLPMVHVVETVASAGETCSVDLVLFECYQLEL